MSTTLRKELLKSGYNPKEGVIIWQDVKQNNDDDDDYNAPGWSDPTNSEVINWEHPILDKEYYDGYGSPSCPRFVAYDTLAVYFPYMYDGSTGITQVFTNHNMYLVKETNGKVVNPTPYPGG